MSHLFALSYAAFSVGFRMTESAAVPVGRSTRSSSAMVDGTVISSGVASWLAASGIDAVPISSAEYVIEDFEAGRFVSLQRNPNYWGNDVPFMRGQGNLPGLFSVMNSARTYGGFGAGSTGFTVDPAYDLSFSFLSTGLMEDSYHFERVAVLASLVLGAMTNLD